MAAAALVVFGAFGGGTVARGQTYVWTGATNNNWNNAGNWSPSAPPAAGGVDLVIDVSTLDLTAAKTFNLNNGTTTLDRTVGTLKFGDTNAVDPTTFGWTVGINAGAGASPKLILATTSGPGTIQVNNGTTTFNPILAGTQGLLKTGAGTLSLTNAANTITGGITLAAGGLSFAAGGSNGNTIDVTGTSTLNWTSSNDDLSGKIRVGDGVTLTLGLNNVVGDNTTFASPLATGPLGTGAVTKSNAGNLTISAANTYTGGTRVNNGRLILIGGDNRLSTAGALTFGNGANSGVLQLGDAAAKSDQTVTGLTISGTGTTNSVVGGNAATSTFTVNNAAASTFNGLFGGAGANENNLALFKAGAGTLTLGGNSTFAGNVTVAGGAVVLTNGNALGLGAKTVDVSAAAGTPNLQLNGTAGPVGLPSTLNLVLSGDTAATPVLLSTAGANVVGGPIALATGGAGAGNTRVRVDAGTLALNGNVAPSVSSAGSLGLILYGAGNGTVNGLIANNGARTLGVTKEGAGTWTLSASNGYGGPTVVSAGRLNVGSRQTGGGAVTVADGATLGVRLGAAGQSLNVASLSLGTASGAGLVFDLAAAGNPTAPVVNTGSFSTATAAGGNVVQVTAAGLTVGSFPLVDYTGPIGGGGFAGLSLGTLPARVSASLVNDTVNTRVLLNVTAFDVPKWAGGVNGNWDVNDGTGTGTANWRESASGNVTRYLQGAGGTDSVLFNDTAGVPTNVLLTTTLTPAAVTVNASNNAYVFSGAGKLSGATTLLKQGTSTLTLLNTGGNDYTGATTVAGGTLRIGDGATAGAGQLGTGDVAVSAGATLALNRPDNLTVANAISGNGTVQVLGPGVTTLSGGSLAFTGPIVVAGGTLIAGGPSALGTAAGDTTVNAGAALEVTNVATAEPVRLAGGTLRSQSGTSATASGPVTLVGGGTVEAVAGTLAVSVAVGGTGGLAKAGAGSVQLSGANTFAGGLAVNVGTLALLGNNTYTGGTTVAGGATLQIGATNGGGTAGTPGGGDIALNAASGTATLSILRGDSSLVLANNITSSGANAVTLGVTGATSPSGTVTLTGNNTFTGNVTVNGGALRILSASALGTGTKTVRVAQNSGPALLLDGSAGAIAVPASVGFQISSDGTIADTAANAGAIVNVAGDNVINGRVSQVNGGGGNGRLTALGGTLTVNGDVDAEGATGARTLLLGGTAAGRINGVVSNTNSAATSVVSLTKDGPGTWTLAGTNTFTGGVTVQAGTLRVTAIDPTVSVPQPLGTSGAAISLGTAVTAATLEYAGTTDTTLSRGLALAANGPGVTLRNSGGAVLSQEFGVTLAGTPITFAGGAFNVNSTVSGAGANSSLTVAGGATLALNRNATYGGPTKVVGGGTLRAGVGDALPTGTTLTLGEAATNTAGTFDLAGNNQTLGGLASAGTATSVVLNSGATTSPNTLTVNNDTGTTGQHFTFAGSLRDGPTAPLALAKSGDKVLTLAGASTYTGGTTASAGSLLVIGSAGGSRTGTGPVSVASGATLGGSGLVGGPVTAAAGAILSPGGTPMGGASPGQLSIAGPLSIDGGTLAVDVASAAEGIGYDQVRVLGGSADLGAGTTALQVTSAGYTPGADKLWIVNNAGGGATTGFFNVGGSPLAEDGTVTVGGQPFVVHYGAQYGTNLLTGGNDVVLVSPITVPEPTAAGLVGVAAAGLLARRRRAGRADGCRQVSGGGSSP